MTDMISMDYRIVNIIANTNIHQTLNLDKLSKNLENSEYDPEFYFAVIYRMKKPKLSILINASGKIIFSGAQSLKDIEKARELFFEELRSIGYTPLIDKLSIQNIVVLVLFKRLIDFNKISILPNSKNNATLTKKSSMRAIIKNEKPRFTSILFRTGKCLIVGLKSEKTIKSAVKLINSICKE